MSCYWLLCYTPVPADGPHKYFHDTHDELPDDATDADIEMMTKESHDCFRCDVLHSRRQRTSVCAHGTEKGPSHRLHPAPAVALQQPLLAQSLPFLHPLPAHEATASLIMLSMPPSHIA